MAKRVVISNSRLNRYGFRMMTEGAMLEQYQRNPILLFMHNRPWRGTKDEVLAIGTISDLKVEGDDITGLPVFDKDDYSQSIERKWESGTYRMVSVGATPIEQSTDPSVLLPGQTRATITKWTLDEVSVVDIGANDDALALKNAKGEYITLKDGANLDFIPIIENKPKMKKIALKYGLPEDASEEQILEAIEKERTANLALKTESERQTLAAITSAVELAVTDKRINNSQKNHFLELGKKVGVESLNLTLAAMQPAIKPMDVIKLGQSGGKTDKKWADLSAEEIRTLKADNLEQYKLMYKEEYGFEPKF